MAGRALFRDDGDPDFDPGANDARGGTIAGYVRSDDGYVAVEFDATPWFEQATFDEIRALREAGWCSGPADAIAYFFAGLSVGVTDMFDHLAILSKHRGWDDPVGFECRVDGERAAAWLAEHRAPCWGRILEGAARGDLAEADATAVIGGAG